jgi:Peptidase family M48
VLIPLYDFYPSIESFLDTTVKKTIDQAETNPSLEPFDIQLLQVLFLIRYVDEMKGNVDNLVTLCLDQTDGDRLALRRHVEESLGRLEKETLISRSGENYFFLTNEERDINKEIKQVDLSNGGSGEGVDGLSLGLLVAGPIAANLILGALSRLREYQADLEAVALTGDPAGLARAIELIGMTQARIAPRTFPGAVRIRLPRLLSLHPDPKDRIRRLRQSAAEERPPGPDERIAIPEYPDERKRRVSASVRSRGRVPPTGWVDRGDDDFRGH